jgi:uncharacterized protein YdeI (YjbR/CyaY-like superfamily)
MASFKQHCAFGFWKGKLIVDAEGRSTDAMGQFGRITSIADLPPKKVLIGYVKQAVKLNDEGVKAPTRSKPKVKRGEPAIPEALSSALRRNRKARATFERFSPSHRREYAEWIAEAKSDETRERRLATTIEWLTEGKTRNWKYERK